MFKRSKRNFTTSFAKHPFKLVYIRLISLIPSMKVKNPLDEHASFANFDAEQPFPTGSLYPGGNMEQAQVRPF
jgi:hypothetical protein